MQLCTDDGVVARSEDGALPFDGVVTPRLVQRDRGRRGGRREWRCSLVKPMSLVADVGGARSDDDRRTQGVAVTPTLRAAMCADDGALRAPNLSPVCFTGDAAMYFRVS